MYLHHQDEFLHNYYKFESVHDGNRDGVVRIFIGLSCELGGFCKYIILDYEEQYIYYQECNMSLLPQCQLSTLTATPVLMNN